MQLRRIKAMIWICCLQLPWVAYANTTQAMMDLETNNQIKSQLVASPSLPHPDRIIVITKNGVTHLLGYVCSVQQKDFVHQIADSTGTIVNDSLIVQKCKY